MERDSLKLLEREDACALLLAPEEVAPWLPALSERFQSRQDQMPDPADPSPDPTALKALADVIWPWMGQMSGKVFTPERIRQLIGQLKIYRQERFTAGDTRMVGSISAIITGLEHEDDPARNRFLNAVCFASLRRLLRSMSDGE